jgi:hypothetical protein
LDILVDINNLFEKMTTTDKSIYFNYLLMTVSVLATFLSANTKISKIRKSGYIFCVFLTLIILTKFIYNIVNVQFTFAIVLLMISSLIYYFIITSSDVISRSKIDKMIQKFTTQALWNKDIKLFGGDLNFFGNVKSNTIIRNKQLLQLINMKFTNIKVLCIKPNGIINDEEDMLRLGFLVKTFNDKIKIKFFIDKKCDSCDKKDKCLICNVCNECDDPNCTVQEKCRYMNGIIQCPMLKYKELCCYCPDLDIRGRLITNSSSGSESAAIFIKHEAGKSYRIREYNSEDKECRMYSDIWEIWWERCEDNEKFLEQCKTMYSEYTNTNKNRTIKKVLKFLFPNWLKRKEVRP